MTTTEPRTHEALVEILARELFVTKPSRAAIPLSAHRRRWYAPTFQAGNSPRHYHRAAMRLIKELEQSGIVITWKGAT